MKLFLQRFVRYVRRRNQKLNSLVDLLDAVCMYNKNKDFFKKYYTDNTEHLIAYGKARYHTVHDGDVKNKRGRKKIEPIAV